MKIPFSIKYRPQIESGEYKVVTTKEQSVRIICWDRSTTYWKIVALVLAPDGKTENPFTYDVNGNESDGCLHNHELDLFIITPEPELSKFEKALEVFLMNADSSEETFHEEVKKHAAELLAIARDQFIKDGYVIEKKAFHDAVEKVAPEVMKEVSDKVDMEEALRLEYEKGKAEALKDLPTWRTIEETTTKRTDENDCVTTETMLVKGCMNRNDYRIIGPECMVNRKMLCIPVVELSKLPGFKEDEE